MIDDISFNAPSADTPEPESMLVSVSEALSYVDTLVYNRVLNGRKITDQMRSLYTTVKAKPAGSHVFTASYTTPHEVLYSLVRLTGSSAVPTEYAENAALTLETISALTEDKLLSRATLCTIWGMLRLISLNSEETWQQDMRDYLGIPAEFDRTVCDRLKRFGAKWSYEIADAKESHCSANAFMAFVMAAAMVLRPELITRRQLKGLQAASFQNETDLLLTQKMLAKFTLLDKVISVPLDTYIRFDVVQILSGGIRVTEDSQPTIYTIAKHVCTVLDMDMPEIYIDQRGNGINAYTTGIDKPIIVLTRMAAGMLDRQELAYIIGHECGHILCGHVKYHMLANLLMYGSTAIPFIGDLIAQVNQVALGPLMNAWSRRSELSADRAGLLACQSIEAVQRALLKLMGFPFTEYHRMRTSALITQALDFQDLMREESFERFSYLYKIIKQDHPRNVYRALELLNWIRSGEYDDLLRSTEAERKTMAEEAMQAPAEREQLLQTAGVVAAWAEKRNTKQPFARYYRAAKTMIRQGTTPQVHPLNTIFSLTTVTEKDAESDTYTTSLLIRSVRQGKGEEYRYPLHSAAWSDLSDDQRAHFRAYPSAPLTHTLYQFS